MPALGQASHLPDQPPGGAAPLSLPSNSSTTTTSSSHQQAAEAEDICAGDGRGALHVPLSGHRCQPEQANLLAMPNSADNSSKQDHHQLSAGGSATMKRQQPSASPAACGALAAKALQQQQQPTGTDDDTLMDQQQHERGSADDDDTGMGDDDGYDSELGAGSDEVLGDEDDEEGSGDEDLGSDDDGMGLQSHRKLGHGFMSSTDVAEYDGSEYGSDEGEDMGAARHEYCRNCTNVMYNGWCPACLHERVNDVLLVGDGTPFSSTPDLAPEARAGLDGVVAATATAAVLTSSRGVAAAAAAAGVVVQPRAVGLVPPVALLFDQRMEAHEEGKASPHPERPDRTRAIITALIRARLTDHCVRVECPEATYEQLAAVHTSDLIDFVKAMAEGLPPPPSYPASLLTQDTYINAHTYTCARLAAGGAAAVATQVASGQAGHGAAIVRPPGHHAESNMAMGFCFFNNAAVAARAAQAAGAQRVLILDWDIHHGNGTQHIFQEDNSVLYMSLHRHDRGQFYPGTGAASEVGDGPGEGYTVNVAWDGPEVQNGDYLAAFQHVVCPIAYEFNPSLIIVSAGFDAADGDPIGGCRVTPQAFAHMTAMLKGIAPLVLLLEGGYNLDATAKSTEACLRVLLGEQPPVLPGLRQPTPVGVQGILNTMAAHARYWGSMRAMAAALKAAQPAPVPPAAPPPQPPRVPSIAAPTPAGMPPILAAAARHSQRAVAVRASEAARAARRERRKRQLFQKVRNQAMACWWARHRRIVAARQQAAALAAQAVLGNAAEAAEL